MQSEELPFKLNGLNKRWGSAPLLSIEDRIVDPIVDNMASTAIKKKSNTKLSSVPFIEQFFWSNNADLKKPFK